jgi:uncharacterized protein (DUF305 family)
MTRHIQEKFRQLSTHRLLAAWLACALIAAGAPVSADEPGRGLTAAFEVEYLKFIINHHYSALRMTELAAGTDAVRDAPVSPAEGTSPSPDFTATPAKARLDELKSLARRANRAQREEILQAQKFLREWYGINHEPRLTARGREGIARLEAAPAGDVFDIEFMEIFSRHHYTASRRSLDCLVASEIRHVDLERYCRGILNAQLGEIDEMRHLLCRHYNICDYQPFGGVEGRHSDD